jgi:hypothetical protein
MELRIALGGQRQISLKAVEFPFPGYFVLEA